MLGVAKSSHLPGKLLNFLHIDIHSSVLSQGPIYDEIVAPSGFRVGELKCVVVRKVFQSEIVTVSVLI